jgi:hypothetical protein
VPSSGSPCQQVASTSMTRIWSSLRGKNDSIGPSEAHVLCTLQHIGPLRTYRPGTDAQPVSRARSTATLDTREHLVKWERPAA